MNNTLDKYTAHCNPCLYNVGNTSLGDWTEHEDLAAAHPSIVTAMTSRLEDLRSTMHENCHRWFFAPLCFHEMSHCRGRLGTNTFT